MIVDSSALIAILRREPGSETLREKLLADPSPRMSAGTLIEATIVAYGERDPEAVEALVKLMGIVLVPVDARHVALAIEGFHRFGKGRHPAGLNYGDLFAYALARAEDEPLLFVGNDFARTDLRAA